MVSLACVLISCDASSQPIDPAEARAYVQDILEIAERQSPQQALRVRYTETLQYHPPVDDLFYLEESVRRHPEHPAASSIDTWMDRFAGDMDSYAVVLSISPEGYFRQVADFHHPRFDPGYTDVAVGGRAAWMLTRSVLISESLQAEQGVLSQGESARLTAVATLFCFLIGPNVTIDTVELVDSGDAARVRLAPRQDAVALEVIVRRVGPEAALGVVSTTRLLEPAKNPGSRRIRFEFDDFRRVPGLPYPIAHRIQAFAEDGQKERVIGVEQVNAVKDDEVAMLTRVPSERNPDPERGWEGQEVAGPPDQLEIDRASASPDAAGAADRPIPEESKPVNWAIVGVIGGVLCIGSGIVIAWKRSAAG